MTKGIGMMIRIDPIMLAVFCHSKFSIRYPFIGAITNPPNAMPLIANPIAIPRDLSNCLDIKIPTGTAPASALPTPKIPHRR